MKALTFLKGLGLGAGLMYFYDPQLGRRRRKLVADQLHHALCEIGDSADVAYRDGYNRLQGCAAELSSSLRPHDNSDRVVHDRVRAKLGRYVSHPGAIHVAVHEGKVSLTGPILAHEVEPLVERLKCVTGVRSVENLLEVHSSAGRHAALQGGQSRAGESLDLLQSTWSPSTRCLVGSLGGALLLSSAKSRGLMSLVKGAGAAWLFSQAIARRPRCGSPSPRMTSQGYESVPHSQPAGETASAESNQTSTGPAASKSGQSFTSSKL